VAKQRPNNPFYALLVIAGIMFCVTACAYGVMTVSELHAPSLDGREGPAHPLLVFLDQHGFPLMLYEIATIGVATFAAIGTDDYWERRGARAIPDSNEGTQT
jgi:hypothetical protein